MNKGGNMGKYQKTIGIQEDLKSELDKLKTHHRDTYGDVIKKLVDEHNKQPVEKLTDASDIMKLE